jgi:hypothetical protein
MTAESVRAKSVRIPDLEWFRRTFATSADCDEVALGNGGVQCGHSSADSGDAAFITQFKGGARPIDRWPELFGLGAPSSLVADGPKTALDAFFHLQRGLLSGSLIEEVRVSPSEVGTDSGTDMSGSSTAIGIGHADLVGCRRPDGRIAIFGAPTHSRMQFGKNRSVRIRILQTSILLRSLIDTPDHFFGTMRNGIPYQSVWHEREELVIGRRRDLYERLDMVRAEDLQDKAVLDVGCNIGINCYLAIEFGAARATGIDRAELVEAATRLNGFYDRPCQFVSGDLDGELPIEGAFDTVFVFAVLGHLTSIDALLRTVVKSGARTVYVETHRQGEDQGALAGFLSAPVFCRTDFIGSRAERNEPAHCVRRYYRCAVAE